MRKRTLLLAATLTTGLLTALPASASAAPSGLSGDFNGDGFRDVAIGVPEGVTSPVYGGYVAVVYGTAAGIDPAKRKVITQNSAGVPGSAEGDDYFGRTLATADFDKDGYADLAVGAPGEDLGDDTDMGSITILWGGAAGIGGGTTVDIPLPVYDTVGIGSELAAGDFDGDGNADIATNLPATTIQVARGPFTRDGGAGAPTSVTVPAETGAHVRNLTAGDVTGDGAADLVIQARKEDEGQSLAWLYTGGADGLKQAAGLPDSDIAAVGDTNKDGYADIALGDSYETTALGGRVSVLQGSASGISTAGFSFHQATSGVPGTAESGDGFGGALAIGDTDGDGYGDVAVGAPGEDVDGKADAGALTVLRGSASGVTATGAKSWTQDSSGVPGSVEKGDRFGSAVRLSDTTKDGRADLAVSAVGEAAPGESVRSGAVWRLLGASTGLTGAGSLAISPDEVGRSWDDETFGAALGG
ncbi:VCBS repeat-containing protein [Streptomyces sp. NPDC060006]|uniref:VCBS repeat-containing protein n=1 Tax=unclassified Streptomyces TaxID=2593676 RepID=UPI00368E9170